MALSRREFLAASAASALAVTASRWPAKAPPERLVIPDLQPKGGSPPVGQQSLGLGFGDRDGILYVPKSYGSEAMPLTILLHGAGQGARLWFGSYGDRAESANMILLAPDSRGPTWDAVRDDFGPDVAFINRALVHVFANYRVDPKRIAIAGFSDGASYGISLGLANGDVVPNVIAFSPGFVMQAPHRGTPRFWVSHGTSDQILNIDHASRPLVAALRKAGYSVEYTEFDGRHEVPPAMSDKAIEWLKTRQGKTR